MRRYIALVRKEKGTCYGVEFPDFEGVVTAGDTMEEALANAREAMAIAVAEWVKDGRALPDPSPLDTVMADRHNKGALAIMVEAPEPESRAVPFTGTLDEYLLKRIDRVAGVRGRSKFLDEAARAELARRGG